MRDGVPEPECTLRAAIQTTNKMDVTTPTIIFDVPGVQGIPVINVETALPTIVKPVIIDGTTQEAKLVQLRGPGRGGNVIGLHITSGGSTIRGLELTDFSNGGILIQNGGANHIVGNGIGVIEDETRSGIIGTDGIRIENSAGNFIGGGNPADRNLIGNALNAAVRITGEGSSQNMIQNNLIGISKSGSLSRTNGDGVIITGSSNNIIADNVISGSSVRGVSNHNVGVGLIGIPGNANATSGNVIRGNRIGTNAAGTRFIANSTDGVRIFDAANNTIGGTIIADRNVISGNDGAGIQIRGFANPEDVTGNKILNNFIGPHADGLKTMGNSGAGVKIISSDGNVIGTRGSGNVISFNFPGVLIANSSHTKVQGNLIGTNKDGVCGTPIGQGQACDFGNGRGIMIVEDEGFIGGAPDNNLIGSEDHLEGNVIAFSNAQGVLVNSGVKNSILGNVFFGNLGPQIDLTLDKADGDDINANDNLDVDPVAGQPGPNGLQNFPFADEVAPQRTRVALHSKPNTQYRIELLSFDLNTGSFVHATNGTTDALGNFELIIDLSLPIPTNHCLSATATDPEGNTSEMVACGPRLKLSTSFLPNFPLDVQSGGNQFKMTMFAFFPKAGGCREGTAFLVIDGDMAKPLKMADIHTRNREDRCHKMLGVPFEVGANVESDKEYEVDLYWAQGKNISFSDTLIVDTTTIEFMEEPELVVLTDYKELFQEFSLIADDFGFPSTGNQDFDEDGTLDFYQAIDRIREYALDHNGIVIDVRHNAYETDKVDFRDNADGLTFSPPRIDRMISLFPDALRYVAIIGTDFAMPYYRVDVDKDGLHKVIGKIDGIWQTDIPYGTRSAELVHSPRLDMAVGRVFQKSPQALIELINAMEDTGKTVDLRKGQSQTWVFNSRNDFPKKDNPGINFNGLAEALVPILQRQYGGVISATDHTYFPDSPDIQPPGPNWNNFTGAVRVNGNDVLVSNRPNVTSTRWDVDDVIEIRRSATMLILQGHGTVQGINDGSGRGTEMGSANQFAGGKFRIIVSTGCNTGSLPTAGVMDYNFSSLAFGALSVNASMFGSTSFDRSAHDFVLRPLLLENLYSGKYGTLGEVQVATSKGYRCVSCDDFDSNALFTYNMMGLPTQRIGPAAPASGQSSLVSTQHVGALVGEALDVGDQTLARSVIIPHFEIVTDEQGRVEFQIPNNGRRGGQTFGPTLPIIEHSYFLPAGATNIQVTLTDSESRPHGAPVEMITIEMFNKSIGPETGTLELSGVYPETVIAHRVYPEAGGQILVVEIVPLQYDTDTRLVTLYDRIDYQVTYEGPSAQAIDGIVLNSGNPVQISQGLLPFSITVSTADAFEGTAFWEVRHANGRLLDGALEPVNLQAGTTVLEFVADTDSWTPGALQLSVELSSEPDESGDSISVASGQRSFVAEGQTLDLDSVFENGRVTVTAIVRDHTGAEVSDLASDFEQLLDGQPVILEWIEGNSYTVVFDETELGPGQYHLIVGLPDGPVADTSFTIDTQAPTSRLTSPEFTYTRAIPVIITGEDDLAGIDTFHLQYRQGEDGEWTDWLT
jgi:hypothetical protein